MENFEVSPPHSKTLVENIAGLNPNERRGLVDRLHAQKTALMGEIVDVCRMIELLENPSGVAQGAELQIQARWVFKKKSNEQ